MRVKVGQEMRAKEVFTIWNRSRSLFLRIVWAVRYHGLDLTLLGGIIKGLSQMGISFGLNEWYKRTTSRRFDKRFGINTAGCIMPEKLDITDQQKRSAVQYQPTASVTFGVVLSELSINYSGYIFIDYGSGQGRALIVAAHFPFEQIIGVEISNSLHMIAQNNVRHFLDRAVGCRNVVLVCEDAITFQLPPKPLVIYMFHPFNQEVLKEVLQNVFRALRESFRHIIIIYQHPLGPHPHHELTPVLKNATFLRPAMVGVATRGWNIYETVTANEFTLLADSLGASA